MEQPSDVRDIAVGEEAGRGGGVRSQRYPPLGDVGAVLRRAGEPVPGEVDALLPQPRQVPPGMSAEDRVRGRRAGDGDGQGPGERDRGVPPLAVEVGVAAVGTEPAAPDAPDPPVGLADDRKGVTADAALPGEDDPGHGRHGQARVDRIAPRREHPRALGRDERMAGGDRGAPPQHDLLLLTEGERRCGGSTHSRGFLRRGPPCSMSLRLTPT